VGDPGVRGGGDHAGGLVQCVMDEAGRASHADPVDGDDRHFGVDALAEDGDLPSTVTRPSPIRSSQTRRLPKPARASTFCSRVCAASSALPWTAGAIWARSVDVGRETGTPTQPHLEVAQGVGPGRKSSTAVAGRAGRGRGAPRTVRSSRRGPVDPAPRRGPPPRCSALVEKAHHAVHIHPRRAQICERTQAAVGHDGEGLEGGRRQAVGHLRLAKRST